MVDSRIIKSDFEGLNKFVKGIAGFSGKSVRIGIFGNKNGRNATGHKMVRKQMRSFKLKSESSQTNAEIGALHEFGSFTKHIPARSFLRMPISMKAKEIIEDTGRYVSYLLNKGDTISILRNLGHACEHWILMAFDSGGFGNWAANSPTTIARKGSTTPLIDTGQLRRSIASKVV